MDYSWHRQWCYVGKNSPYMYYIKTTLYYIDESGKKKSKTLYLHNLLTGMNSSKDFHVNHKDHDTFNNRKSNLEVISCSENAQLRNSANINNKTTGVRNVNYIKSDNVYRVQLMKNYHSYKYDFPATQFEEACEFARLKRIELFGIE